jgi:hypothetical protein
MTDFLLFEDAKSIVQKAKIKSKREFKIFNTGRSVVTRIPVNPDIYYRSQWISWTDFLNTNNPIAYIKCSFLSYDDAKNLIKNELLKKYTFINGYAYTKFTKTKEFDEYKNLLPKDPKQYYKSNGNVWISWDDFLHISYINAITYNELKSLFKKYKITDIDSLNYFMVHISPDLNVTIPRDIETTYMDRCEWISWDDLFGIKNIIELPSGNIVSIKSPDISEIQKYSDDYNVKTPPIGIIPRSIYDRNCKINRFNDLTEAIIRYNNENYEISEEWISEYKILMLELNIKESPVQFIKI